MKQAFRNANRKRKADDDAKRSRADTDQLYGGSYAMSKVQYGKAKRKTLAKAWKMLALENKYLIARWQSLGTNSFDTGSGSLPLWNKINTTIGVLNLPMYAFNLTSLAKSWSGKDAAYRTTVPMYALSKGTPGTAAVANWEWDYVAGVKNHPQGNQDTCYWWPEETNTTPGTTKQYTHAWSDIKLVLYGARQRKHVIHTQIVQFQNGFGPERMSADTATVVATPATAPVTYDGDNYAARDIAAEDAFWDKFWADKIGNPIRTTKHHPKADYVKVLKATKTVIDSDSSSGMDAAPMRVVKEMFLREDKLYNCIDDTTNENVPQRIVNLDQVPAYNDAANNVEAGIFPRREADKWLLIYADSCFNQANNATAFTNQFYPSFDINVRTKWLVTN